MGPISHLREAARLQIASKAQFCVNDLRVLTLIGIGLAGHFQQRACKPSITAHTHQTCSRHKMNFQWSSNWGFWAIAQFSQMFPVHSLGPCWH